MNTSELDTQLSGWYSADRGELLTGFAVGAADSVLEVGCGEGHAAAFCAGRGAEMIVSDLDAGRAARVARALRASPARAVYAFAADMARLPLPDARVNRVIAMEVLEHVDDPPGALAELVRVAQPGAQLLLTVPDPLGERVHASIAAPGYFSKPNHINVFERDEFDDLVRGAGLVIEGRVHYGFYWSIWWFLFWACRRGIEEPWHELLVRWDRTWEELLSLPDGLRIKAALDEVMPKSQAIIARKP